jgi:hypothetical protein
MYIVKYRLPIDDIYEAHFSSAGRCAAGDEDEGGGRENMLYCVISLHKLDLSHK